MHYVVSYVREVVSLWWLLLLLIPAAFAAYKFFFNHDVKFPTRFAWLTFAVVVIASQAVAYYRLATKAPLPAPSADVSLVAPSTLAAPTVPTKSLNTNAKNSNANSGANKGTMQSGGVTNSGTNSGNIIGGDNYGNPAVTNNYGLPPRTIPPDVVTEISNCLRATPGHVKISAVANDADAFEYARQWLRAFNAAGWNYSNDGHGADSEIRTVMFVGEVGPPLKITMHGKYVNGQGVIEPASVESAVYQCMDSAHVVATAQLDESLERGTILFIVGSNRAKSETQ